MTTLANAAPRLIFGGINDLSTGTDVRQQQTVAQHTPLLRIFSETGPEETTLIDQNSGSFNSIYGSQTLARRSKYFNLQSLLVETLLAEGNPLFIKRLKPSDAPAPARIILALDIVEDRIPKSTVTLDGFEYPPIDPESIEELDPSQTVLGHRARLVMIEDNTGEVGSRDVEAGALVSTEDGSSQSTIYPLLELPARFFGSKGNLAGMRLWAPTTEDANTFDEETADEFETRMYRLQFLERSTPKTSAVVRKTAFGEDYVDMCFTPGAYSASTDKEYYAPDVVIPQYEDDGKSSGTAPLYSPFSELYVYQDNLEDVQEMIYTRELAVNPAQETHLKAPGQVDVFGGIDINGDRYDSLMLEGPLDGGIAMGKTSMVFAKGGGDGTLTQAEYENLVDRENLNFGELAGDQYQNLPVYPFSTLYDTGLSMDSKFRMMEVLGRRQDLRCVFTTYVEQDGRAPTASEEVSRAQAIMARLRAYPESTLHSTPVCRADIILQTGRLADGSYRKPVPLVIDYAQRWAQMAGAGSGVMTEGKDIDDHPNNMVQLVSDLNVDFFNQRTQSALWEAGATFALSFDRVSHYYPALHSVYSDDTSVLISPITVAICTDVLRLVTRVHAEFSGNATLTKSQLQEQADDRILDLVENRYNDRVVIEPETYFTGGDELRGYSWHCRATIYANNPRNTMFFDIETRRMEDLNNESV